MAAEKGQGADRSPDRVMVPTLTTPRFIMRALQPGDENALFTGFSDPATMQYWSRGPFTDLDTFRTFLLARNSDGGDKSRIWIVVPRSGGDPVAHLGKFERGEGVTEFGYMVLPGHTRLGIARECSEALITHLFREESYARIFADTDPRNLASNRLLQSLGFTREAHLRSAMKTHIGWCDTWLWGMLADEWRG
jgi:[ribosomal protein S5]-alanine N-acetyltransferase